jgi:hypothetical protein
VRLSGVKHQILVHVESPPRLTPDPRKIQTATNLSQAHEDDAERANPTTILVHVFRFGRLGGPTFPQFSGDTVGMAATPQQSQIGSRTRS